jgi:DNA-binding HxlR family transcriptional regulator
MTLAPAILDRVTADRTPVHEPRVCDAALARAFGFLGKRWNGVILGTLTNGPAGFAELRRAVGGVSDSMLSERLSELAGAGLVLRTVDPGPPVSVTYQLAPAGSALLPAMQELTAWAAANLPAHACAGADAKASVQAGAGASTEPASAE